MYQHNVCTVLTSSVLQTSYVSRIEFDASQETSTLSFVHFTRVPHANGDGVRPTKIAGRANDNSTHVIITQWPKRRANGIHSYTMYIEGPLTDRNVDSTLGPGLP